MRDDVTGGLQRIRRKPLGLEEVEWFDGKSVGDDILQLLPPRMMTLDQCDLEFIDKAFHKGNVPGNSWVRRVD